MKILTIFAGRENYLNILCKYLDVALKEKKIDEVHFWNFTRKDSDFEYLKKKSNIKRTSITGDYIEAFPQIINQTIDFKIKATNDIHIKIKDRFNIEYEIVIGGWSNTQSVIRKNGHIVLTISSPNILDSSNFQNVRLQITDENQLHILVNDVLFMSYPLHESFSIQNVFLKTAHGCEGIFNYTTTQYHGYYLMDVSNKSNWCEYYQHYNLNIYHHDLIMKCDDDIVFMDLKNFDSYIEKFINSDFDILFPNIINNSICAYYQQQMNLIPTSFLEFEYTNEGFGSLWNCGKKAEALHSYFIDNKDLFLNYQYLFRGRHILQVYDRFSINFFIMKGSNWYKIKDCGDKDDERFITIHLNKNKTLKLGLYLHFIVSHFSFYRQLDTHMNSSLILSKYQQLAQSIL